MHADLVLPTTYFVRPSDRPSTQLARDVSVTTDRRWTIMSPRLRPLQLPQLVEERRKRDDALSDAASDVLNLNRAYSIDSSSSDVPSPVTPTFSTHGHLRCSSSTSSFELTTPATTESPASPAQSVHVSSSKRVLDDVEEEEHELDEDDDNSDAFSDQFDLCEFTCKYGQSYAITSRLLNYAADGKPCIREQPELSQDPPVYPVEPDIEYDLGCLSDSDFQAESRSRKRSISFTSFSQRISSRLASLSRSRRRTSTQRSVPASPAPEPYDFDVQGLTYTSRTSSCSRSSSRSTSARHVPESIYEHTMPPTPALSTYQSTESIVEPVSAVVDSPEEIRASIERERAHANTPLLPPFTNGPPRSPHSHTTTATLPSPLESPNVASPHSTRAQSPTLASPPLSAKPSISSFSGLMASPSTEMPPIPEPDAWSDRLGHANFTIEPQPYGMEASETDADEDVAALLARFHSDWDAARTNYTKHLARTGEHYGVNSKTYVLTEAKWAEVERTWRRFHEEAVAGCCPLCYDEGANNATAANTSPGMSVTSMPMPNVNAEGKFPERGDQDIVGPMVRQASITTDVSFDRNGARRPSLWRRFTGPLRKQQ